MKLQCFSLFHEGLFVFSLVLAPTKGGEDCRFGVSCLRSYGLLFWMSSMSKKYQKGASNFSPLLHDFDCKSTPLPRSIFLETRQKTTVPKRLSFNILSPKLLRSYVVKEIDEIYIWNTKTVKSCALLASSCKYYVSIFFQIIIFH